MKRAWVTELGNGIASISMRYDMDEFIPHLDVHEFPTSKTDPTLQKHVGIGVFHVEDLVMLRNAIDEYLERE